MKAVKYETSIGKLKFSFPLLNAAGVWCTTEKQIKEILESEAGGVVFKSITLRARQGNPKPCLFYNDSFSVNSMGLPNRGLNYYLKIAPKLRERFPQKPFIASIAGFSLREFEILLKSVNKDFFNAIEINLSCPNVSGKSIFAYEMKKVGFKLLARLRKMTKKTLGVKLPPYTNRFEIKEIAKELVSIGIDFVTLTNTWPLGTAIDVQKETPYIKPNLGVGGVGGRAIKPISLAQVLLFYHYSRGKLKIVGVGGIKTAEDIYEYILAGASAAEIATAILQRGGPSVFSSLKKDLNDFLRKKGVSNLKEKIGALKFL